MSLKQLGVLAAGESVQGDELADALITLEGLLSQWATKRLYIHKAEQITLNLNGSAKVSPNNTDAPDYKTSISGIVERGLLNSEPVYIVRDTNTTQDDANVTYSVKFTAG